MDNKASDEQSIELDSQHDLDPTPAHLDTASGSTDANVGDESMLEQVIEEEEEEEEEDDDDDEELNQYEEIEIYRSYPETPPYDDGGDHEATYLPTHVEVDSPPSELD